MTRPIERSDLRYIKRWNDFAEKQEYAAALKVLDDGLQSVRSRPTAAYLKSLRQRTIKRLALVRSGWTGTEAELRQREAARKRCSFCTKRRADVSYMLLGADGAICGECISTAYKGMQLERKQARER